MNSENHFRVLLDEYVDLWVNTQNVAKELFPKIYEILELWCEKDCQYWDIGEMWVDKVEHIDPWIGEPCLNVTLKGYEDCDVVSFPARYLDMNLEEVRTDVLKFKEEAEKQKKEEALEVERKEYMRLKAKFEGENHV